MVNGVAIPRTLREFADRVEGSEMRGASAVADRLRVLEDVLEQIFKRSSVTYFLGDILSAFEVLSATEPLDPENKGQKIHLLVYAQLAELGHDLGVEFGSPKNAQFVWDAWWQWALRAWDREEPTFRYELTTLENIPNHFNNPISSL